MTDNPQITFEDNCDTGSGTSGKLLVHTHITFHCNPFVYKYKHNVIIYVNKVNSPIY